MLALCAEKPLVGLIKGKYPVTRECNNPDKNGTPSFMVQTKTQTQQADVSVKFKTPFIIQRHKYAVLKKKLLVSRQ